LFIQEFRNGWSSEDAMQKKISAVPCGDFFFFLNLFPLLKQRAIFIRPPGFGVSEAGILQYNKFETNNLLQIVQI
jgi:hypothetical protein